MCVWNYFAPQKCPTELITSSCRIKIQDSFEVGGGVQFSNSGVWHQSWIHYLNSVLCRYTRLGHSIYSYSKLLTVYGRPNFGLPDKGTDLLTHSVNTDFPICKVYYSRARCTRHTEFNGILVHRTFVPPQHQSVHYSTTQFSGPTSGMVH